MASFCDTAPVDAYGTFHHDGRFHYIYSRDIFPAMLKGLLLRKPLVKINFKARLQNASSLSSAVVNWKNSGKTFNYNGLKVFYLDQPGKRAERLPLLLIHGYPGNTYDWNKVWPDLRDNFSRIISADLLGHGFTDKPYFYPYAIVNQASMLENLLKTLGVSTVHVLSHDYGVSVTQELLARHNEREKKNDKSLQLNTVCFTNGGLFSEIHSPHLLQKMVLTPFIGGILGATLFGLGLKSGLRSTFGPDTPVSEKDLNDICSLVFNNNGLLIQHKLNKYIPERKACRDRWVGAMQNAKIPLHTIYGDADPINPSPYVDHYRKNLPKAGITVLERIGHWPMKEAPQQYLKAYLEFINKHG